MKQDVVLAFLGIILTVLVLTRVREKYTYTDRNKIHQLFTGAGYTGTTLDNIRKYLIKVIINELEDDTANKLSNVNLLVDTLNTGRTNQWAHYATVSELDTMFETAYTSGESGLTARDRMVLRAIALPGIDMTVDSILAPITYTSEGVPDFSTTIINESGKTSKEMLLFCFKIVDKLLNERNPSDGSGVPWTPEIINYINSYIPNSFTPKYDINNLTELNQTFEPMTIGDIPAKGIWLHKAVTLGPAYIANLAENKWRLDLDWTPPA